MSARTRPPLLDVDKLIDDPDTRILVCCGSGGVGKTTTAAALALRAASRGRRVVVLTIDPARRLAQSLGLSELSNHPRAVDLGADSGGELHAMMLDMRRTFDDMVLAHAGRQRAQQILSNPFYQTISSSFSGTQEYMAMEKLGQLVHDDQWDLVVVDTPPSRSALDFLDAPQRLSTVLDGKIIRMLSAPARAGGLGLKRLVGAGFGLFTKAVSTIIGGQLLADASAFVQAFDSMFGGFRQRAQATYELLRSPGTAFLVIAAPEPDALREASYFVDRLGGDEMPLAGLVVNRTHPVLAELPAARALAAAEDLERAGSAPLASAVLRLHADRVAVADREKRTLSRFTRAHPAVALVGVPALPSDVHDLDGLREIGHRLAGE
ncbi:ArsA-related P-loop ATPase [Allokutzneria sp. NRRL B-24872]|uniref:ArsA family ATPase n=1 Tax=Allokutzneria sp. NRRL B-24872 TaxID=1137961 RepID=UPI000A3C34B8|nr:ArsA-related P-loop ATPase [Allokutzneria sp. NRRL B-24872]